MSKQEVRVGQVWMDNDPRYQVYPRWLKVKADAGDKVVCLSWYGSWANADSGRKTTIQKSRFKPTRTGYTLIRDEHGNEVAQGERESGE